MTIHKLKTRLSICFKCAKIIKKNGILIVPPIYMERAGDFPRAYHKRCYAAAENRAKKELRID